MLSITLFCKKCRVYLGPIARSCSCGWARPDDETTLPNPGKPLWVSELGGPARGRPIFASEQVCFAWGERGGCGGISCFHRSTHELSWKKDFPCAVEGGIITEHERVYCGTNGTLSGKPSELYCFPLEQNSDERPWIQRLTGGVWGTPVILEQRLFVGCSDGSIGCFDALNGAPLPGWDPLPLPKGRMWLALVNPQLLIAVSQIGQITALDPLHGHCIGSYTVAPDEEIKAPPLVIDHNIVVGTVSGNLYLIPLKQTKKTVLLADGMQSIVAAPIHKDGILYVGAGDYCLHAIELESGKELWPGGKNCGRRISSSPLLTNDLVVVGSNDLGLRAFDARSGELVWIYPLDEPMLSSTPASIDGVIYAGTEGKKIHAIPWHLGKYIWAAQHAEQRHAWEEAGTYYAIGAWHERDLEKREKSYSQAATFWESADQFEWPIRLWEYLGEDAKTALAYRRAALDAVGRDNRLAAEYFSAASQVFWRIGDEASSVNDAQRAARLGEWPLLSIKQWTNPNMIQQIKGPLTFRIENVGRSAAQGIHLSLGGSTDAVYCSLSEAILPTTYFDVTLQIIPTRPENDLWIQVTYYDEKSRREPFRAMLRTTVVASEPPHIIKMKDVVALRKMEINIQDAQKRPVHFIMDTVYAPNIQVNSKEQVEGSQPVITGNKFLCPVCGHANIATSDTRYCDKCGTALPGML